VLNARPVCGAETAVLCMCVAAGVGSSSGIGTTPNDHRRHDLAGSSGPLSSSVNTDRAADRNARARD
jgi:hypothetical protein